MRGGKKPAHGNDPFDIVARREVGTPPLRRVMVLIASGGLSGPKRGCDTSWPHVAYHDRLGPTTPGWGLPRPGDFVGRDLVF